MDSLASPAVSPAALHGVRVIEMGQLIAGPFCGKTLGEFGADVIKIEAPADPSRPGASICSRASTAAMVLSSITATNRRREMGSSFMGPDGNKRSHCHAGLRWHLVA